MITYDQLRWRVPLQGGSNNMLVQPYLFDPEAKEIVAIVKYKPEFFEVYHFTIIKRHDPRYREASPSQENWVRTSRHEDALSLMGRIGNYLLEVPLEYRPQHPRWNRIPWDWRDDPAPD